MTQRLKGKTALVTAAGQGIGRAIVDHFVTHGAHVIATDINIDGLSDVPPSVQVVKLDVTDKAMIQNLANDIPKLDILMNCAGVVHNGTILECTDDEFDFAYDLNVRSMYFTCQVFMEKLLQGGGSIVNISSIASSVKGIPNRFAYCTSKAGVIGLTKAIAADFVTQGVRCNAICPGTVDSPSLQQRIKDLEGDYETNYKAFVDRQAMKRIGNVDEIAHLAVYLASDESSFTTGTVNVIDGGWVC